MFPVRMLHLRLRSWCPTILMAGILAAHLTVCHSQNLACFQSFRHAHEADIDRHGIYNHMILIVSHSHSLKTTCWVFRIVFEKTAWFMDPEHKRRQDGTKDAVAWQRCRPRAKGRGCANDATARARGAAAVRRLQSGIQPGIQQPGLQPRLQPGRLPTTGRWLLMLGLSMPFALLHRLGLLCPYTGRICSSWDIIMCVRSFSSTEAWICDILGCHGTPLSYWRMGHYSPAKEMAWRWLGDICGFGTKDTTASMHFPHFDSWVSQFVLFFLYETLDGQHLPDGVQVLHFFFWKDVITMWSWTLISCYGLYRWGVTSIVCHCHQPPYPGFLRDLPAQVRIVFEKPLAMSQSQVSKKRKFVADGALGRNVFNGKTWKHKIDNCI